MIGKAGIAIFLFGNKRDDRGRIVAADGMREEYSIVQALGLSVIAVGATGWVAQEISRDLVGKISGRSKAFQKACRTANDSAADIDSVVKATLTMASEYKNL